jgi:hypothetical protein
MLWKDSRAEREPESLRLIRRPITASPGAPPSPVDMTPADPSQSEEVSQKDRTTGIEATVGCPRSVTTRVLAPSRMDEHGKEGQAMPKGLRLPLANVSLWLFPPHRPKRDLDAFLIV